MVITIGCFLRNDFGFGPGLYSCNLICFPVFVIPFEPIGLINAHAILCQSFAVTGGRVLPVKSMSSNNITVFSVIICLYCSLKTICSSHFGIIVLIINLELVTFKCKC